MKHASRIQYKRFHHFHLLFDFSGELDAALTTYNRTVLFSSYDVTDILVSGGSNAVGLTVGNGWFNQLPFNMFGAFRLRETMAVGPPRALLQLTVTFMNGSAVTVATGPNWECAIVGPRTHNNLYFGEAYDAREEASISGWDRTGFQPPYGGRRAGWRDCLVADNSAVSVENISGWSPPTPRLQWAPPVRITARWHPVAAWPLEGGGFVLDFGRELVGFLEFSLEDGHSGEAITVLFAERLAVHDGVEIEHGDVDASSTFGPGSIGNWCAPGSGCESMWGECVFTYPPAGRVNGAQTITYIMKDGKQTYRDAFSFHAFRYVHVSGYPLAYGQAIPLRQFTALRLHTDNLPAVEAEYNGRPETASSVLDAPPSEIEEPASFQSSSVLLNEVDRLADVAFRSNWIGIQSDCPGRERLGYGGDMMTSAEAGMYMFASTAFYAKRALDYADARRANGALPETAPFVGIDSCLTNPELGGIASMPWGSALPYTLNLLLVHADDQRSVAEHYPVAREWVALLEAARQPDGTLHNGLGMPGVCNGTGEALMGTAFLYQQATLMIRLSLALELPAMAAHYTDLATSTHAAFNNVFFNDSAGAYFDGVSSVDQNAQLYALGLGLVPTAKVPVVVHSLVADVAAQNNSFIVDPFAVWLAHSLVELGAGEVLMDWLLDTRYPSYGYFVRNTIVNATAMMEHWNTPEENSSHNHAWMNSVALFYRSRLLGIMPTAPAWASVRIRPWVLGRGKLTWARGVVSTVLGPIHSSWKIDLAGSFSLNVSLPANVNASVHVPTTAGATVHASCAAARRIEPSYSLGGKIFAEFSLPFVEACSFSSSLV